MPELGSGLYTGFILPNQTTTPYQVWVPCFDGFFSLGSFKNIGKNMLSSITTSVLEEMRQKCSYYHITQELSPGNFRFNEAMGAGTTEEFTPKDLRDTNLPDLSKGANFKNIYNGSASGKRIQSAHGRPCDNASQDFVLELEGGTRIDTLPSMPTGQFVEMDRWQKVLVAMVDNGTTGVIVRAYPWAEDYNSVTKSIK